MYFSFCRKTTRRIIFLLFTLLNYWNLTDRQAEILPVIGNSGKLYTSGSVFLAAKSVFFIYCYLWSIRLVNITNIFFFPFIGRQPWPCFLISIQVMPSIAVDRTLIVWNVIQIASTMKSKAESIGRPKVLSYGILVFILMHTGLHSVAWNDWARTGHQSAPKRRLKGRLACMQNPLSPQKKSGRKYVCESPSLIEQQVVTFAHASGLHCWEALVDSCWREIVLADSCSEALSREIFFCIPNQQPTCIIDWILEVFCMAMAEGPFSRLIFVHLAPLMKQIKRSRGRLLWYVDLLTFKRSRISGLSSMICRAA